MIIITLGMKLIICDIIKNLVGMFFSFVISNLIYCEPRMTFNFSVLASSERCYFLPIMSVVLKCCVWNFFGVTH